MVPLIAKFLLVFFTLCYYNGGVLASLASKLPASEEDKSEYIHPLIEGYCRQTYGGYHKDVLTLISYFAGVIPRKLSPVTVTFPVKRRDRKYIFVDMGEIFKQLKGSGYGVQLVFGSPSEFDLRTCESLYKWKQQPDEFGVPGFRILAEYFWDKYLFPKKVTFDRSRHNLGRRQRLLGPLTLVVTKDDRLSVAYAPVKIAPLRIWGSRVKYDGENKLELPNPTRLFPEIIPADFPVYITRGRPESKDKLSVAVFHAWLTADDTDKMELERKDNSPSGKRDFLTFYIKADNGLEFKNGERITLVFENEEHTIIVFSKGTIVIEPTREAAQAIAPTIYIEAAEDGRELDSTESGNVNHSVVDNTRPVDGVPVFHGIYRIGILFFFVFCAFLAICYFSGIISHSDQHVQKYSDENKPNAETQTAQIQDDDHSNCCCCCV
eukprot:216844_1